MIRWANFVVVLRNQIIINTTDYKLKGRGHSEDLGVDKMTIWEWP